MCICERRLSLLCVILHLYYLCHLYDRPTDKPWSYTKNYVSLTYFTDQNCPLNNESVNGIFKPAEPHSPWNVCYIISFNKAKLITVRLYSEADRTERLDTNAQTDDPLAVCWGLSMIQPRGGVVRDCSVFNVWASSWSWSWKKGHVYITGQWYI